MDVAKVKASVENVRAAIKALTNETIELGKKTPREFNGLQSLGKVDALCDKINERLEEAVKRTAPKAAKEPKAKDTKKK